MFSAYMQEVNYLSYKHTCYQEIKYNIENRRRVVD